MLQKMILLSTKEYMHLKRCADDSNTSVASADPYKEWVKTRVKQDPIFERRQREVKKPRSLSPIVEEVEEKKVIGDLAGKYLSAYITSPKITDTQFGIYKDKSSGEYMIGDSPIQIENNTLILKGKKYQPSVGLWELLTRKHVDMNQISEEDLDTYKDILTSSKGHIINKSKVNATRTKKFKLVISKLFPSREIRWTTYNQRK